MKCSTRMLFFLICLAVAEGSFAASARSAEMLNVIAQGDRLYIAGYGVALRLDLQNGRFDVFRGQGEAIANQAFSQAAISLAGSSTRIYTLAGETKLSWYKEDVDDALGPGRRVVVTRRLDKPKLELTNSITTYERTPGMLISLSVKNRGTRAMHVESLVPFTIDPASGSSVFVGLSPDKARIAGFTCFVSDGERKAWRDGKGPDQTGKQSCWYLTAYDALAGRGLVAGFVTQRAAAVSVQQEYLPAAAPREPQGDRLGFTTFRGVCAYQPVHRLDPGATVSSEIFALLPSWEPPVTERDELARIAAAYSSARPAAAHLAAALIAGRENVLNRDKLAAFLDALGKVEARPDVVILDPGLDTSELPGGLKAVVDAIHEKGFLAGLVWRPFFIAKDSPLATQHARWLMPQQPVDAPAPALMDISRPEIQDYLKDRAAMLTRDLGFDALALRDTSGMLHRTDFFHKGLSSHEIYRSALAMIRTAAGQDTILLAQDGPALLLAGISNAVRVYAPDPLAPIPGNALLWAVGKEFAPCGADHSSKSCSPTLTANAFIDDALSAGVLWFDGTRPDLLPRFQGLSAGDLLLYPKVPADGLAVLQGEKLERPWALLLNPFGAMNQDAAALCRAASFSEGNACHGVDLLSGRYLDGADLRFVNTESEGPTQLFLVRPVTPVPQLIFINTGPAALDTDVSSMYWDAPTATLHGSMVVRKGFAHALFFHMPQGFSLADTVFESEAVPSASVEAYTRGPLLHVRFTPKAPGTIKWALTFANAAGDSVDDQPDAQDQKINQGK